MAGKPVAGSIVTVTTVSGLVKSTTGLAAKAGGLGLPGLASYPEDKRVDPGKTLATQILGLAGIDGQGLAGIEYADNKQLSGKPGQETVVADPAGQGSFVGKLCVQLGSGVA